MGAFVKRLGKEFVQDASSCHFHSSRNLPHFCHRRQVVQEMSLHTKFTSIVSKVEVGAGLTNKQIHQWDQEQSRQSQRREDSLAINRHPGAMKGENPPLVHKK